MKKSLIFTYGILLLLTFTTALLASSEVVSSLLLFLILGISVLKFFLVAFQFMELRKANTFWKYSLLFVILLIVVLIFMFI